MHSINPKSFSFSDIKFHNFTFYIREINHSSQKPNEWAWFHLYGLTIYISWYSPIHTCSCKIPVKNAAVFHMALGNLHNFPSRLNAGQYKQYTNSQTHLC